MIKNWRTAAIWGLVLWVALVVGISLIELGLAQLEECSRQVFWLLIAIPITIFAASRYFKKYPGELKEGLMLGAWFVGMAIILDMIIRVPLFYKFNYGAYWTSTVGVFGGFAVIIICSAITALAMQLISKKEPKKVEEEPEEGKGEETKK